MNDYSNIKIMGARLLVERDAPAERIGSIIIPESGQEIPIVGHVRAVGPGAIGKSGRLKPMDVQVGDRIAYGKRAGVPVRCFGKDHAIIVEADIFGVGQ